MRKNSFIFYSLFAFSAGILIFAYSNCGNKCGTSTGNPMGCYMPASRAPAPNTSIERAMCVKLSSCFQINSSTCEGQLLNTINITQGLGLDPAQYSYLGDVYTAVNQGSLKSDTTKLMSCTSAIDALSCTSATVQSSYNPANPTSLDNTYRLLQADASCRLIFY